MTVKKRSPLEGCHLQSVICHMLLRRCLELLRGFEHVFDAALHVEGLLGDIVVLALDDLLEGADRVGNLDVLAGMPVNCSATWKGCERNFCTLRARATVSLSSSESSSMPRMAMMSCRSL
jgi:hypothetical protein